MSVATIPGVSITEIESGALAIVNSASCVPLIFVADTARANAAPISSLRDYLGSSPFDATNIDHQGLRLYFENGGGPCFVVKYSANALADALRDHPEITLVVANGTDITVPATEKTPSVFYLLDSKPTASLGSDTASIIPTGGAAASKNGACYYPNLSVLGTSVNVPASIVVAGVYCAADRNAGPWKAPANVDLLGVKPTKPISDADNEILMGGASGSAVNPVRGFLGRPAVVWGARTMVSASATDWRYVTVRRLFNMVETDVGAALRSLVFRPNNEHTWELARAAVENYLRDLWKQGGLAGEREHDAFNVAVGVPTTMTAADVTAGKLIVNISLAALRPAEFIEIQLQQSMNGA